MKIKQLSNKLDSLRIRLFLILEQTGLVNYYLQLLKKMCIYLVFYISKLELAPNNILLATNIKIKDNKYKVKRVVDL